jgi:RNA polymerase subunit RPABC4/transcription elongation factor Spt4
MEYIFSPEFIRVAAYICLGYFFVICFTLILWVVSDSMRRSSSFLFQVFSTLLVMVFNVLGLVIYLLIRPGATLQEEYDQELEREYILKTTLGERCHGCQSIVQSDFKICPFCTTSLKTTCTGCIRSYAIKYRMCPYCGENNNDHSTKKTSKKSSVLKKSKKS